VGVAVVLVRGIRMVPALRDEPVGDRDAWPRVSIVVPARNEERDIEQALLSLLQLDYPDYEVIAVDDRSADDTGRILDRIAARDERLRVTHVQQLPAGWLGKNHALQRGAESSTGAYLLFTDADVVMRPDALRRAVAWAEARGIDHLPLSPGVRMPSALLQSFVVLFTIYFSTYFRPWSASDPESSAHVGIGAFNLVRREAYFAAGGHTAIAMRPDDDVKLGKLLKCRGYRSQFANGIGLILVPWYASLGELIRGLEKNAFSGVDYRLSITILSSVVAVLFNLLPFLGVFVTVGWTRMLFAVAVTSMLIIGGGTALELRFRPWVVLLMPVCILLFIYIQWRATILTLYYRGIRWRDTFYPLDELKANRL
jgi:cellulose synthase/poly-beta-1,6-N-acetylglucosamine synthase-like glycosyltransferase